MPHPTIRRFFTCCTLVLLAASTALAQSPGSIELPVAPADPAAHAPQWAVPSKGKLYVITLDQPGRRQTCRVQSVTSEKLVCSRAIGAPRTYLRNQISAILLPGDNQARRLVVLGLNVGLGTAIWGTVVLAAACPACAAATAIAAWFCFGMAGAILITDDVPDRLLYLSPGQQLSRKLGYVQSSS